jgi:hypothetical protein
MCKNDHHKMEKQYDDLEYINYISDIAKDWLQYIIIIYWILQNMSLHSAVILDRFSPLQNLTSNNCLSKMI